MPIDMLDAIRTLVLSGVSSGRVSRLGSQPLANIAYLLLANLLRVGLGVVTSAIIFRVLGPQDVGRLTTALSVVGLLSIIGEFGLRDAAINFIARSLRANSSMAGAVGRTFLVSKTFLSTVATGVALSAAGLIASRFFPEAQVESLIRLAAFSLLADGLLGYSLVILEAHQNFAAISLLHAVQSAVRFGLILALFVASQVNLVTLMVLETVVPLAAFIYSLRFLSPDYRALRRPFLAFIGPLFHFSKWIAVAVLCGLLVSRLDVMLLGHYASPAIVGFYAAALTIGSKIDLIKIPVLTTAFPDACRRTGRGDLRDYVRQHLKLTLLISLACLPLFFLGQFIIGLIYGAEYLSAVPAFALLLAANLVSLNVEPSAFVLYPLNKPAWVAAKELLVLAVLLGAGLVLIPLYGMLGAACCVLLRRIAEGVLTYVLAWRYLWRGGESDENPGLHPSAAVLGSVKTESSLP
jgi:O-antigen/teichoic acid export membrane protein